MSSRTSEDGEAVAGEGRKDDRGEDRAVDSAPKIIVAADRLTPLPQRRVQPSATPAPPRVGGLWLVIVMYVLAGGALAYALYERFIAG